MGFAESLVGTAESEDVADFIRDLARTETPAQVDRWRRLVLDLRSSRGTRALIGVGWLPESFQQNWDSWLPDLKGRHAEYAPERAR